jgi:hypothetical protein
MGRPPRPDPLVREFEGCRWDGDRLSRIARYLRERPQLSDVVYSTRLNRYEFSENSLDELQEAIRTSTVPVDPEQVENVTISATGPGHAVCLVIDGTGSRYRIESADPTWIDGVANQLDDFAKQAGGRYARKRWRYRYPVAAGVVLAVLAIAGLATRVIPRSPGATTITAVTLLIGVVAAHLNARAWGRRRRTRCNPFGKLPPVGWWATSTRTERIMTVSAVISGLAWLTALATLLITIR